MRILFGTDNYYPNTNGAARFSHELAKGLAQAGHAVYVVAPSSKFNYTLTKFENITIYGIPSLEIPKIIHPAGIRIPVPLVINMVNIREVFLDFKPDLVHIQDHFIIGDAVIKLAKKANLPKIGTNHFLPENFIHYLHPPKFAKEPISKLAWRQFVSVYQDLDIITTPTKTAAGLLKGLGLKNPIIPISCGVDLRKFNPQKNGSFLKKRFKINSKKQVVLFVGRLDQEKNVDLILKSFAKILPDVEAHLVIAGKGKEKPNLIRLTKSLGISKSVTFTGFVAEKDLPFLYQMADIFTIASIAELQSIATMEAMASGLPVVAAKVLALPELVHEGKNGYLFKQGDINTLSNSFLKILTNSALKRKMSKSSLGIIKHHNLNNTITSYEKLYQKLLKAAA